MSEVVRLDFQLLATSIAPKEITRLTGISPDVELERGARNKAQDLPRQNIWSKMSSVHSDEVSDHWTSLRLVLIESKDVIKRIALTGRAELTIVIKSRDRIPSIRIPAEMSEFAGFVGATVDIDHIQF